MNSNIEALLYSILKKDQTLTPTVELLRAALESDKQSRMNALLRRIEKEVIYVAANKDKYIAFVIPFNRSATATIEMIASELERFNINPRLFEIEPKDENSETLKVYYE